MASAPGAVHTAPQTGTPVPTEATDPAARAATVGEATAAQCDADVGARASPFVDAAIAAATPDATPPARAPMPAESPARSRETWRDWMPEGVPEPVNLMTREAFVARLNAIDVDVDEGDLRYWEYHGALPRAIKRWHDGANRVFYPRWLIYTVALLRALQAAGLPLRSITPRLRDSTQEALDWVAQIEALVGDHAMGPGPKGDALLGARAAVVGRFVLLESLDDALAGIGQRYRAITGKPVRLVRVSFLADDEEELDRYGHWLHDEGGR